MLSLMPKNYRRGAESGPDCLNVLRLSLEGAACGFSLNLKKWHDVEIQLLEWFGRGDVGEMLPSLWLHKHRCFSSCKGISCPTQPAWSEGEGAAKHIKKVSLLSGNHFLDSPFGSWKCKVLKTARALPRVGTVCSVGLEWGRCWIYMALLLLWRNWACSVCKGPGLTKAAAEDLLQELSVIQVLVPLLLALLYWVVLSCVSVPCCAAVDTFRGTPPGLESKYKMMSKGIETMQGNKETIMVSCLALNWIIPLWLVGGQWITQ